jgi:hypothetical protein
MVIGKLTSYLALGLVGAFLLNTLIRPASALGTGAALQETGIGIGAIGKGIGDSIRSIGSSSSKLLDPLFSLRDLVYSSDVSAVTWSSGTTRSLPSLSPAAKSYYRALGVKVTWEKEVQQRRHGVQKWNELEMQKMEGKKLKEKVLLENVNALNVVVKDR